MGIWERLGNVIKSYINSTNSDDDLFGKSPSRRHSDPDLNAAYEELDDFLSGKEAKENFSAFENRSAAGKEGKKERTRQVPEELRKDFAELGLAPDATAEECKEAYKKLLKTHHPDRHAKHEENMKKATEKTARVNAAYKSLMTWFRLQN